MGGYSQLLFTIRCVISSIYIPYRLEWGAIHSCYVPLDVLYRQYTYLIGLNGGLFTVVIYEGRCYIVNIHMLYVRMGGYSQLLYTTRYVISSVYIPYRLEWEVIHCR